MSPTHVERRRAPAAELHALDIDGLTPEGQRGIFLLEAESPAIVIGSTQPAIHVDHAMAARAGVEVVRRRSGGGAVWVAAEDPIWVDVWIPRTDPRWHPDVALAFAPVGEAMASALAAMTRAPRPPELLPHVGPMRRTDGSSQVCFAGVGPGEVMAAGRKVVGISQRRTRGGARFQCALYRHWDPAPMHGLLADPPDLATLAAAGAGLDQLGLAHIEPGDLAAALARSL